MGGRGSSNATAGARVMSLDEYYSEKGVPFAVSNWNLDKVKTGFETARAKERRLKEGEAVAAAHAEKRAAARNEYEALVAAGKVRPPTNVEKLLRTATGHPDNASVQAARRVLTKRGIDWRTGKKL